MEKINSRIIFEKSYTYYLILAVLVLSIVVACATTTGSVLRKETLVDDLKDHSYVTGKTKNGTTYFIKNNPSHQNQIIFSLIMNVGSVMEEDDQLGLAHFVEHMGFNGTKKYPANEMIKVFRENGMRFGEDVNAYTSYDETVFYLVIPDDKPELVSFGIEVLEEWLHNMSYNSQEIEKEKGVVQEEVRASEQPFSAAYLAGEEFLLEGTKYGVRYPGGKLDVIGNAPREVIKSFYDKWYKPSLAAISIVGNIDENHIEDAVLKHFQQQEEDISRPYFPIKPEPTDSFQVDFFPIEDEQNKNSVAKIYFRKPVQVSRKENFFNNGLDQLVYTIVNQRLQEVVRTSVNVASMFIMSSDYGIGSKIEEIILEPKEGKLFEGFKEMVNELEKLRRWGVSEEEFQQVIIQLINDRDNNDLSNREWVQQFIRHFVKGQVIEDNQKVIAFLKNLSSSKIISLNDINRRLTTLGKTVGGRMAVVHALSESPPSAEEFVNYYQSSASLKIESPQTVRTIEQFLSDEQNNSIGSGKFVRRKFDQENQGYVYTLGNGITVFFKSLDTLEKRVQVVGITPNNNFLDYINTAKEIFNVGILDSTPAYLTLNGYGFQEVANYFRNHEIGFHYTWGDNKSINISFPSNKLKEGFEVLYSSMRGLQIDDKAVNNFSNDMAYDLTSKITDENFLMGKNFFDSAFPDYPNRLPLEDYRMEYLDIALLNKILGNLVDNPGAYTFYITGNISEEELAPYIEKYIGSFSTSIRKNQKPVYDLGVTQEKVTKVEYERGAGQSSVYYGWVAEPTTATLKEAVIRDIISQVLDIKMLEEIREQESGVYSIGNIFFLKGFLSSIGNVLLVSFSSKPERTEELIEKSATIVSEFANNKKRENIDFSDALSQARLGLKTEYNEYERQLSYYRVMYLMHDRGLNPFRGVDNYLDMLEQVTDEEVLEYLNEFLAKAKYIEVIQRPKQQN